MSTVSLNATSALFPLLEGIPSHEMERVMNQSTLKPLDKNELIFQPGDQVSHVYFVKKGRIKISGHFDEDKEVIKQVLYPGEVFGVSGLFGEEIARDSASALDHNTEVVMINLSTLREMMRSNAGLSMKINAKIFKQMREMEDRVESLLFKKSRDRIIDFLKKAASEHFRMVGDEILIKPFLTHTDIARVTDTSRQTVTLVLNELRSQNLIYFDRKRLLIRDLEKLR